MQELEKEVEVFVGTLRKSKTYTNYCKCHEALKAEPELKAKVDDYRMEVYNIQNSEGDVDDQRIEDVLGRYSDILEKTVVSEFLDAENDLCKLLQYVTDQVIDGVELD